MIILIKKTLNVLLTLFNRVLFRNFIVGFTNQFSITSHIYDSNIGKYNYFGPGVVINRANIKNYCSVGPNVIIGGMEHDYSRFSTSTNIYKHDDFKKTIIEDDVWIGANAIIRTGVIIGKGSVIGANSLVLNNVPPMTIVVGSPAKKLKNRFENKLKEKKYNDIDFTTPPNKILEFLQQN